MTAAGRPDPLALPPVPQPAPATHRWRDLLLVALFVLALALPGLALIFTGSRTTTRFENRAAAPWPTGPAVGFAAAFERAFADRFGGRDAMIRLHHGTKAVVFGVSPVPQVVLGLDNWLYYAGEDGRAFDRVFRRNPPPTAEETSAIADGIARRIGFLADRGVRYVLAIVPDKYTIYPEHVPAALHPRPGESPLDLLLATLAPEVRAHVLDLRPALAAAKNERQVYYRTDSHWNHSGGWVGYREILAALRRQASLPERPYPLVLPAHQDNVMSGDLARMIGITDVYQEPRFALEMPPGWSDCARNDAGSPPVWGAPRQVLRCPSAQLGKVAVYHDSMGWEILALLAHDLRESLWVHGRNWDLAHLASTSPNVVVDLIVERSLPLLADTAFLGTQAAVPAGPPRPSRWRKGNPPGLSAGARSAASCMLDTVNGQGATGPWEVPAQQPVLVEGWAVDREKGVLPHFAWLVLQDGKAVFHAPLDIGLPRPDVATALRASGLAAAGYRATVAPDGVPAGNYGVSIAWVEVDGWVSCDARQALRFGAKKP